MEIKWDGDKTGWKEGKRRDEKDGKKGKEGIDGIAMDGTG